MKIPTLINLRVVGEKTLFLEFSDGTKGEVIIDFPKGSFMDQKLSDTTFFAGCTIASSKHAIERANDIDIDATAQWIVLRGQNPFLVSK